MAPQRTLRSPSVYVCSGPATHPLCSVLYWPRIRHVHSFIHWVTANPTVPFQIINSIAYSVLSLNLLLGSVINKDMPLGGAVVLKTDHIPVSLQKTEDPFRDKLSSPKMKSTVSGLHAVHPTQYGHSCPHKERSLRSQVPPSLFIYFVHMKTHQESTCFQAAG